MRQHSCNRPVESYIGCRPLTGGDESKEGASSRGDESKNDDDMEEDDENKDDTKENVADNRQEEPLDPDVLEALGDDPVDDVSEGVKLHSSIKKRWDHWCHKGLSEKDRESLQKKYPSINGLEAPVLNPEISTILPEYSAKRDSHMLERTQLAGAALAALGSAISDIIEEKEGIDKTDFVEKLNDAAKLITHVMFSQTESRKAFILPGIDKTIKSLLEKSKTDEYLFGKNLSERIKQAQALAKVGENMKNPVQNKKNLALQPKTGLNSRSLPPRRPALATAGYHNQPGMNRPRLFFKNKQHPFNPRVQNQPRFKARPQGKFK